MMTPKMANLLFTEIEESQRVQMQRMRRAIEDAIRWFEEYGLHHQTKGDMEKAGRNYSRANVLRAALANGRAGSAEQSESQTIEGVSDNNLHRTLDHEASQILADNYWKLTDPQDKP